MASLLDTSPSPQSSEHQSPPSHSTTQNGVGNNNNNQSNETVNSSLEAATNEPASDEIRIDTINNPTSATAKNFHTTNATGMADDLNSDTHENEAKKDDSMFECNICLDTAKEAVVSMCGHLFCWPCLHQWLETRPTRQLCPVCKAAISKEKVIPLYGRGSTKEEDPRSKVPPRPAGQRTEPEPNTTFQGFGFGDGGFQMSLGIGAFPFGIFTSTFNFGTNLRSQNPNTTVQLEEDQFLSRAFLWVTVIFLAWLVWA